MARYVYRRILWSDRIPPRKELTRIRKILRSLDYDAPVYPEDSYNAYPRSMPGLGPYGLASYWRSPLQKLQHVLNILHIYGYPCSGAEVDMHYLIHELDDPDAYVDNAMNGITWLASSESLGGLDSDYKNKLKALSRRFDGH